MNEPYMKMNEDYFADKTDYLSMFCAPDCTNLQKTAEDPQYVNVEVGQSMSYTYILYITLYYIHISTYMIDVFRGGYI